MPAQPWYPYAPDQAFGSQVARDQELVEAIQARLDGYRRLPPRAANKASLSAPAGAQPTWLPSQHQLNWMVSQGADVPVTTAAVLEPGPSGGT
jgi:hypothetical protein